MYITSFDETFSGMAMSVGLSTLSIDNAICFKEYIFTRHLYLFDEALKNDFS